MHTLYNAHLLSIYHVIVNLYSCGHVAGYGQIVAQDNPHGDWTAYPIVDLIYRMYLHTNPDTPCPACEAREAAPKG
jgi:hypothetical protein